MKTVLISTLSDRGSNFNKQYTYTDDEGVTYQSYFVSGALAQKLKPDLIIAICTNEVLTNNNYYCSCAECVNPKEREYKDGSPCENILDKKIVINKFKEEVETLNIEVKSIGIDNTVENDPSSFFLDLINAFPDDEVLLHADFSGGKRNITDMIVQFTALLPLLSEKLFFDSFWYSDNVKHTTRTGHLTKTKFVKTNAEIIEGIKRYVETGDANLLKAYYKDKDQELQDFAYLLDLFSKELAMCQIENARNTYIKINDGFNSVLEKDPLLKVFREPFVESMKKLDKNFGTASVNCENFEIGSVDWCWANNNYQAGLTILNEVFYSAIKKHVHYDEDKLKNELLYVDDGYEMWKNRFILKDETLIKKDNEHFLWDIIKEDLKMALIIDNDGEYQKKIDELKNTLWSNYILFKERGSDYDSLYENVTDRSKEKMLRLLIEDELEPFKHLSNTAFNVKKNELKGKMDREYPVITKQKVFIKQFDNIVKRVKDSKPNPKNIYKVSSYFANSFTQEDNVFYKAMCALDQVRVLRNTMDHAQQGKASETDVTVVDEILSQAFGQIIIDLKNYIILFKKEAE